MHANLLTIFSLFQNVVTKVTADYDRWTLMQSNEPLIVQLQSYWRGTLVRRPYQERLNYLQSNQDKAVRLQAYWKGYQQRKAYQERLAFLKRQAAVALRVSPSNYCLMKDTPKVKKTSNRDTLQYRGNSNLQLKGIQIETTSK